MKEILEVLREQRKGPLGSLHLSVRTGNLMSRLFDALRRVADKDQGAVFIDGHKAYRHWMEPEDTVNLEVSGISDVAFVDQDVQFDDHGRAQVSETNGHSREVRILVMVPFGPRLQLAEMIAPPENDTD